MPIEKQITARDEILWPRLVAAYHKARLGKRKTLDEQRFEQNDVLNLLELMNDINNRTYKPSRGIAFITRKPVIREIFAAPFRDRIVHHLLFDYVAEWWDRRFIYDSYSCRKGKGNLFGIKRLYHNIMSVSENGKRETWVLKLDLQGYFMSLPRAKLFEMVCWGLDRQFERNSFEYKTCKYLWREIIFDDPTMGVKVRGGDKDWRDLPPSKSLFHAREGCGIVIGNLTSQLLSNIYLDKLDRFIVYDLGLRHYGRYVDDFYLVDRDKIKLLNSIPNIEKFLIKFGLVLHPKKRFLQEVNKGVPFLGAVAYPFRIQPGKRLKRGFFNAARNDYGSISFISYHGAMQHFRHKKWWRKAELICNSGG